MTRLANLVARTVARSGLGVDVVLTMGEQSVRCRATWSVTEDDRTFMSADHVISDSVLRIPAADLAGDPRQRDPITVDGQPMFVSQTWRRHAVWLVEVTKRRPS